MPVRKLSQIATAGSPPTPTDQLVGVQGGTTDVLFSVSQLGLSPAGANLTFYVSNTGSNTNPGTIGSPFLTIQHAVSVAGQYNYQGIYFPTINVANGTYSEQVILSTLNNCPQTNGGVIALGTNVVINDLGTNWTFLSPPSTNWSFTGTLTLGGSYGGFAVDSFAALTLPPTLTFSGTLVNGGITVGPGGLVGGKNAAINTTTASMGTLFYTRGLLEIDGATVTFTNAISFPTNNFVVGIDSVYGFFALAPGSFVNPANVTASVPLIMTNGAFFEANSSTLSGGSAIQRSNFPGVSNGGVVSVDATSIFMGDIVGAGNLEFDNVNLLLKSNVTSGAGFAVNSNTAGGHEIFLYEVGSAGFLGQTVGGGSLLDLTNGNFIYSWDTSGNLQLTGALKWSAQTGFTFNAADTSLSRTAAATLAVGNGTAGDASGSVKLSEIFVGANATITTSASAGVTAVDLNKNFFSLPTAAITVNSAVNPATMQMVQATVIGTRDLFVQITPDSGAGWGVVEGGGAGLQLGTGSASLPVVFNVNRVEVGRFSATTFNSVNGYSAGGVAGISATITTAKVTPATGANGSMTFVNGILTAQTQAT